MTHQDRVVCVDIYDSAAGGTGRDVFNSVRAADGVVGFLGAVTLEVTLQGVVSKFRAAAGRKYCCMVLSIVNTHLV